MTGVVADEARAIGLEEIGASDIVFGLDDLEGPPFDFILDAAGGPSLVAAIRLIAPGGDIVVYGNSSDTPAQISFSDFRGHALARITAFFVYESGSPPTFGEDLQTLADLVADGRLHPQIGLEVPWSEANTTFEALANRRVNGKVVLLIE